MQVHKAILTVQTKIPLDLKAYRHWTPKTSTCHETCYKHVQHSPQDQHNTTLLGTYYMV